MSKVSHPKFIVEGTSPEFLLFYKNNNDKINLPALWLRERATSVDQIDLITQQRFMNSHEIDSEIKLELAEIKTNSIKLGFSDGYVSDYQISELSKWINSRQTFPSTQKWKSDLKDIPKFDWVHIDNEESLLSVIDAYLKFGFIILCNTPVESMSICEIAGKFGHIRTTNFGKVFEVKTKPNSNDLAYRAVALGPHTDNPYREPTPGIQLLHCLINETSGGLSTLVDSLSCLDVLKELNPEGFELLSKIAVTFIFEDEDTKISQTRPILSMNAEDEVTGMHYSPRLDWLPLIDEQIMKSYQKARSQLSKLLNDKKFELKFKLMPGDCMMFDNNRVLHGRTIFDPTEGARHLQGCYIDRDGPESLYHHLCRKLVK